MVFFQRPVLPCCLIALLLPACVAKQEEATTDSKSETASPGVTSEDSSWAGEHKVADNNPNQLLTTAVEYAHQGLAASSRDAAARGFLQAAAHAKKLAQQDPEMVSNQPEFFANMYYYGARGLGIQGKPELALTALEEAIGLGFSDFDYIMTDDDLVTVRELSSFGDELEKWKARQQSEGELP